MIHFKNEIYRWFSQNKRDLPWRSTKNPYKIWLSEIILQQTRVIQGITYYNRFTSRFPNVNDLAAATEDEILKLWQGLGYYSRARNLHFTSKVIVNEYNGIFPNNYESILKLKGIGSYTAAAIASIAFNLPHSAVDGNVYRVLSRYFGIDTPIDSTKGKKEFQKLGQELLNTNDPGTHNQALMEFGALQCKPKLPNCNICPLITTCQSYFQNTVEALPVKSKKTKQSQRFFYYYLFVTENHTFLQKRTGNDIWKNLYQLPLNESEIELSETDILKKRIPFLSEGNGNVKSVSGKRKHILSHQIIFARVIYVEIANSDDLRDRFVQVNKKDISKFAVPRLLELFFNDFKLIK